MKWEVFVHKDDRYIEVVTYGIADGDGSQNMARDIAKTMRENKVYRALIDHRNIENVTGDTVDIYHRPKFFRVIGVALGIKIAEIIKPEHEEHFRFFETVCVNMGYKFYVFQDRDEALGWLLV